jgi:homoprotocatechuate degradation regulator HpaR
MSRNREEARMIDHRNLPLLLLQARELVVAHFRPMLNRNGITEQQWRIVRVLVETGPLEPREIGEWCRISSPSLAGVLARMAKLKLISRKRMTNDQRRVVVSLTSRSRRLALRLAPEINATYREIERLAGARFCRDLYGSLDELIGALAPRLDGSRQER